MLEPRQVREAEFLKVGVKRRWRNEATEFAEQAAVTIEQLLADNNTVKAANVTLSTDAAAMNSVIDRLEAEKTELLNRLSQAKDALEECARREAATRDAAENAKAEAEAIITRANERAGQIVQQARNEQLAILNRADALITQKALTFEGELKEDVARWQEADKSLRSFKAELRDMIDRFPDGLEVGINETAKNLWRRLCNSLQEERLGDGTAEN